MIATINLNEKVKVKLTKSSHEWLRAEHTRMKYPFEFKLPELDKDGYSTFQLWDLMNRFGEITFLGCDSPFQDNIIIVGKD